MLCFPEMGGLEAIYRYKSLVGLHVKGLEILLLYFLARGKFFVGWRRRRGKWM